MTLNDVMKKDIEKNLFELMLNLDSNISLCRDIIDDLIDLLPEVEEKEYKNYSKKLYIVRQLQECLVKMKRISNND